MGRVLLAVIGAVFTVGLNVRLWVDQPSTDYGPGFWGAVGGLLHTVNLLFHEAGHALTMITGSEVLVLVAGTAFQLLVPAVLVGASVLRRQIGTYVVSANLLAASFYSARLYIADARDRALPLLSGNSDHHDWGQLIYEIWNAPGLENTLATIMDIGGILVALTALAVCVIACVPRRPTDDHDPLPGTRAAEQHPGWRGGSHPPRT